MKFWGLLVAFLYVFILAFLFAPLASILMYSPNASLNASPDLGQDIISGYARYDITMWCIFAIAFIAQGALLSIPVEIPQKRPVTKRTIVPLVLATSFMVMLLMIGAMYVAFEVFKTGNVKDWIVVLFAVIIWGIWALVFFRWSRRMEPLQFIERQCRWLYRGSILELLIAVPSHIYVRQRHECCAGIGTFIGIACGIAVMLFSFGPGVFFLFRDRIVHARGKNKGEII